MLPGSSGEPRQTEYERTLRVLIVTPRFRPDVGGVETVVEEVSTRLADQGVDVTVLTTATTGDRSAYERAGAVTIRRLRAWPRNRDYRLAPGIWSAVRRGDHDIVHVQSYHTLVAPLAMLAACTSGTPFVVTFHGGGHSSRVRHAARRHQMRALRPLLVRADALLAVARFEIDLYGRWLGIPEERFTLIPNGTPTASTPPQAVEEGRKPLIASVGRLERYKGHRRVIDAMPHVLRQVPDAHLWIAGSGPDEGHLRDRARSLGLADRVEIRAVDPAATGAMVDHLAGVSVLVSMSEWETHPIAALEGLSAGCRLVVLDDSGLRELADAGLARRVVRDAPPADLGRALAEALHAPAPAARPTGLGWDEHVVRLRALYRDVLRRRACGS